MSLALAPIAAKQAQPIVQEVKKALTGDFAIVRGRVYRRIRLREYTGKTTRTGRPSYRTIIKYEAVEVEAHVNPVTLAIGAGVGIMTAAIGAWVLGFGFQKRPQADVDADRNLLRLAEEAIIETETHLRDHPEDEAARRALANSKQEANRLRRRLRIPLALENRERLSPEFKVF